MERPKGGSCGKGRGEGSRGHAVRHTAVWRRQEAGGWVMATV